MPAGATGRPLAGGLTGWEWRTALCQRAWTRALFLRHGCRHGGLGAPAPELGYENMRYVAQNPRAAEPVQHNACVSDPKQAEIPFATIAFRLFRRQPEEHRRATRTRPGALCFFAPGAQTGGREVVSAANPTDSGLGGWVGAAAGSARCAG